MLPLFSAFLAALPLLAPASAPPAPSHLAGRGPLPAPQATRARLGYQPGSHHGRGPAGLPRVGGPAAATQSSPPPAVLYPQLSKTLDSLAYVDQWPQQRIVNQLPDSTGRDLTKVELDNFARHQPLLEKIVRQYGFPGFRQVGEKSANNFWLLVQHADAFPAFQRQVLQLMLPEVKRKNANPSNYAYLVDRIAVNTGKPEEYGTQVEYTGPGLGQAVPRSLRDPAHVNQRRAAVGLEPLENYLGWMTKMHVEMNTPKAPSK